MWGCVGTALRRFAVVGAVGVLCLLLTHCTDPGRIDPRYGVSASPRVVDAGNSVPKGGGTYRVGAPYMVGGRVYVPEEDSRYRVDGLASWYGDDFHGRLTANGEIFDLNGITAAHPTLPLPSYARVTNLSNGRSIIVRVNDRGPFHGDRVIDLSVKAAQLLGFHSRGTAWVRVEYVGRAPMEGSDDRILAATLRQDEPAPAPNSVRTAGARLVPVALTSSPARGTRMASAYASDADPPSVSRSVPRGAPIAAAGVDLFLNGRGLY
ncbi:MAG TPA: septal ring lytic transglycosylase RlpA family protein [Xanthobacteraceae bacterium]|nr:septal ring lytic transglycosylase RlpA family protein [Xanthobacteraceae bacterium]